MPRPTRLRALVAPSLSLSSLSFMIPLRSSGLVHDADEMLHRGDHAAHGRRIFQRHAASHLVEAQAHQRRTLACRTADWASDLLDRERLALLLLSHVYHSLHRPAPTAAVAGRGNIASRLFLACGRTAARLQRRILDAALGGHILRM